MPTYKDNGALLYFLMLGWLGVLSGIPGIVWGNKVALCAIIAASFGIASLALQNKESKQKSSYEYVFSKVHLCVLIAYIVVGFVTVGFGDVTYDEIRHVAKAVLYFLFVLLIVFIVENLVNDAKEKSFMKSIRIGDCFCEENSEDIIRSYIGNITLQHRTIWIVRQIGYRVKLQDVSYPSRIKTVSCSDLKKMKRSDVQRFHRTYEYYEALINALKKRASEEIYHSQNR